MWPLALLFVLASSLRNFCYDIGMLRSSDAPRPVASVGNISSGGTGKTPLVLELVLHLKKLGLQPVVLARGYGSDAELNDEAAELQGKGVKVVCDPDRHAASLEHEDDADCFVLDDGFQHRKLARAFDIVVVDATRPPWNDAPLPVGLLREGTGSLERADALVVTRCDRVEDIGAIVQRLGELSGNKPVFTSVSEARGLYVPAQDRTLSPGELAGKNVAAFCGIGNPSQFFDTLEALGANLLKNRVFPDHHRFSPREEAELKEWMTGDDAEFVITTAKDAARTVAFDRLEKYAILHVSGNTHRCEELLRMMLSAMEIR